MCNIAGYSGNKQAAPILLEILRKQQPYDGDMMTGVATIHNGKIYSKKLVGDVDAFLSTFDLSELPGTIGIAHSRPGGDKNLPAIYPNMSPDDSIALLVNGTLVTQYRDIWKKATAMLNDNGYTFPVPGYLQGDQTDAPKQRTCLIDYYIRQGMSVTKALAKTCDDTYTDNVTVLLHQDHPDSIFALRNTRPLQVLLENGEVYVATTRYGFPAELENEPMMLPLANACIIKKDGVTITADKMEMEPVSEMTPYTYAEGYKRFEALLRSEKAPMYFDELEYAVRDDMRDLWEGDHACIQHGRLVYDMLWQFDQEGRLKKEMRIQDHRHGPRHRWYFWLED